MSDVRILMHKKVGVDWVPVTDDDMSPSSFASLTGKPTTLAGYGITDGAQLTITNSFTAHQNFTTLTASGSITCGSLTSLGTISTGVGSTGLIPATGAVLFFEGNSINPIAVSAETTTAARNITLPDKDGSILVGSILSANVDDASSMPYVAALAKWGSKLIVSGFLDDAVIANGDYTLQNDLYEGRQYWVHDSDPETKVRWDSSQWTVVTQDFGTVATGFYQDVPSPEYVTVWVLSDIDYGDCFIRKLALGNNSIPSIQNKFFCLTDDSSGAPDKLVSASYVGFNSSTTFSYADDTTKTNHLNALGASAMGRYLLQNLNGVEVRTIDNVGSTRVFSGWSADQANGGSSTILTEVSVNSGTAAAGYARIVVGRNLSTFTGLSGANIDCSKGYEISFVIGASLSSSTGCARFIVGSANSGVPQTSAQNALTARGWGIEFKENTGVHQYRLFAHNGTTYATGSWNNFTAGAAYPMKLVKNAGSGTVSLFVATTANGEFPSVATTTLSGAPTSSSTGAANVCLIATNNGSGTTSAVSAKLFPDVRYRIY